LPVTPLEASSTEGGDFGSGTVRELVADLSREELESEFVALCAEVCATHPFSRVAEDLARLAAIAGALNLEFGDRSAKLPDFLREECWRYLSVAKHNPGSRIVSKGQKSTLAFFIVLDGTVELQTADGDSTLRCGGSFGAEALLDAERYRVSAVAGRSKVRVLVLKKKYYDRIVRNYFKNEATTRFQQLSSLPAFVTWPNEQLANLSKCFTLRRCEKDEVIMREGDTCDQVFVVRKGLLGVVKLVTIGWDKVNPLADGARRRVEVARLGPGHHISNCYQEESTLPNPTETGVTQSSISGSRRGVTSAPGGGLRSAVSGGTTAPFTVVCHTGAEIFSISAARLFFMMGEDPASLRAFRETSMVIPVADEIQQQVLMQIRWSEYKRDLIEDITAGPARARPVKPSFKTGSGGSASPFLGRTTQTETISAARRLMANDGLKTGATKRGNVPLGIGSLRGGVGGYRKKPHRLTTSHLSSSSWPVSFPAPRTGVLTGLPINRINKEAALRPPRLAAVSTLAPTPESAESGRAKA
jgi:CRP-like cAMP-binding protein